MASIHIHGHGGDYSNLHQFDANSTGLPSRSTGGSLQSISADKSESGTLPPLRYSNSHNQRDNSHNTYRSYDDQMETSTDFFGILTEELEKIDKFYIGKLASLRIRLEAITALKWDPNRTHHNSGSSMDLITLRDIYVELAG